MLASRLPVIDFVVGLDIAEPSLLSLNLKGPPGCMDLQTVGL